MIKEKESDIVKAILDYLAYKKIVAWRNQAGMIFGQHKGKKWAVKMGRKGVSDIIGIMPDGSGRIFCLEVKTKTGKLTDDQSKFLGEVWKHNAVGGVVRSVDDVEYLLEREKKAN